ncbi:YceI family protein [bacterium]|nr:YceI family protein [bacterium]
MLKRTIITLVATILILPASIFAQGFSVDKSHSNIRFEVTHMMVSKVSGSFDEFDIEIDYNADSPEKTEIKTTIQTNSVDTDHEKRDGHLRSDDFFGSEEFPVMTFTSKNIDKIGPNKFSVKGELTIRNLKKEVSLNVVQSPIVKDPWGNERIGFEATTTITRIDYGLKWNKVTEAGGLLVGEEVEITIHLEMVKQ